MRLPLRLTFATATLLVACADGDRMTAPPPQPPPPAIAPQPSIRLVFIDSTRLPLDLAATDRTAGRYVFRVPATAPALAPGDYLAGKQGGLFLGRVRSVSRSGDVLTVTTAPAAWHDVLRPFTVRIPLTPGAGSGPSSYGEVRWGPWYLVDSTGKPFRGRAPFRTSLGAPVNPSDFNPQSFAVNGFDLCGFVGGTCDIEADVVDSHFSLDGDITVSGYLDILEGRLAASASLSQQLDAGVEVRLSGSASIAVEVPLGVGFARDFTVGPFTGGVTVGLILGVEASVSGTFQPYVAVSDAITTGASFSTSADPAFDFNFAAQGSFDAGSKVAELGEVGLKISVGPKAEVELGIEEIGGFYLTAAADGYLQGTETPQGPTENRNWYVLVKAGTEASFGAGVKVDILGLDLNASKTFPGPDIDLVELWGTGDLNVTTHTTGVDVYPGQTYTASVSRTASADEPAWDALLSADMGVDDSHEFPGGTLCHQFFGGAPLPGDIIPEGPQDCDLVGTAHAVALDNIAWNCSAVEPLPAPVAVQYRNPFNDSRLTSLTLNVVCGSAFATVRDQIGAFLTLGKVDFTVVNPLLVKLTAAEEERDLGDIVGAANVLHAFSNVVSAQEGKHITPAAAAELQAYAALLEQCYLTAVPTCSSVATVIAAGGALP